MKADIGDFETSRGYPLDLSAAATEIPGYEGCSAALQAAYNALPLGAQYVIRTGIATIPAGAVFRKTSQTLYGSGGRITRVVNPTVDTINFGVAADSFIGTLAVTPGGGKLVVSGAALRLGNGAATTQGIVTIYCGNPTGAGRTITAAASVGTLQAGIGGAADTGMVATVLAGAGGAFTVNFTFSGASASTPVVIEYLGIKTATTASVT
jgi:hypothetical protein